MTYLNITLLTFMFNRAYPALAEAPPGYPESPQKAGVPPIGFPQSPPEYPQVD